MKNYLLMLSALCALASCSRQAPKPKAPEPTHSLVVYYSQNGATRQVAQLLSQQTGADIAELRPVEPYDADFQTTIARCQAEMAADSLPALQALPRDVAAYDTLYLGYPVWFGTYALPIASLLRQVDLTGKVVIPFCTFGSGGLNTSSDRLKEALPGASVLPGYGVRNARIAKAEAELEQFLIASGIKDGALEVLPDYSDQGPLTDDDRRVFDAACSGYPMPLGTPVSVGRRTTGQSTDYLFTVETQQPPKESRPALIYVTVGKAEGSVPEFTQVVR